MEENKKKYDDNRYEYEDDSQNYGRHEYEEDSQNYGRYEYEEDSQNYGRHEYEEDSHNHGRYDYEDSQYDDDNDSYGYYNKNNVMDNLGEWLQDIVQGAVDDMNFDGLNESIHRALERARNEMTRQMQRQQKGGAREASRTEPKQPVRGRYRAENGRYRDRYEEPFRDTRERKPVAQRQPGGWLRKIPGKWSGPAGTLLGACGFLIFGILSLAFAYTTVTLGAFVSGLILECIFVPLTIASGVLFARGRNAGKRVKRIREYARVWGEKSFVMLEDLAARTGYSLKLIRKDVRFILDRHLIYDARLDENETCLMLTEEAGRQYDEAVLSRMERERMEQDAAKEREKAQREMESEQQRQSQLSEEERKMYELQEKAESCLQEIRGRKERIRTPEVKEKISRLEMLLSRIFVCVKEYPENLSQIDRLMEYYLPSVMKLLRVYEDMENQPIQTDNIRKTRTEIEASLQTVYQGLEAMYDDLFQDVAMDVTSDIRVLEAMLAKDGWGGQELHSSTRKGSVFDEV